MRHKLGIITGKVVAKAMSISSGGTALPGLAAEKISPGLLNFLIENNFPKGVVLVTGTNGKTTTTRMISAALSQQGHSVLTNKAGSNLPRGLLAALLSQADTRGRIKHDMAVLEVDEGYFPRLMVELRPVAVALTNIFRDQLDRYGEVDAIVRSFTDAFKLYQPKSIVFNADDPLVYSIAVKAKLKATYFGIDQYPLISNQHEYTQDIVDDPIEKKKLKYTQRYFGHIGKYRSENGEFERPKPKIVAKKIDISKQNNYRIVVSDTTESETVSYSNLGIYNIYNVLAAATLGEQFGIKLHDSLASINSISVAFGRAEQIKLGNMSATILLVKNPTGFNQVISSFLVRQPTRPVLFAINDNLADGRDISWLWDSGLEALDPNTKTMVTGSRAYDMALRLKYANIKATRIVPDIGDALSEFEQPPEGVGYIVTTYTALLKIQDILHKHSQKGKWS